jgi:ABC-type uncharacterized transport system YnjBCD substrate-binding protein
LNALLLLGYNKNKKVSAMRIFRNFRPQKSAVTVTPQNQAASDLADDYVNKLLGYDVQERYNEILKPKGFLLKDPLADAALWGGAALLAGGAAGNAVSEKPPKTKEELMEYVKSNPELMVSYVQ